MTRRVRLTAILQLLSEKHKISIQDLAQYFSLSQITIRKDVSYLEKSGLLRRSHGNVLTTQNNENLSSYSAREIQNIILKKNIVTSALSLLKNDMVVYMDNSSTVTHIVPFFKHYSSLTVITNSMALVRMIEHLFHVNIGVLGGIYERSSQHLIGPSIETQLQSFNIDVAFMGAYGFQDDYILDVDLETSIYKKLVRKYSKQCYIFTDHTKFDNHTGSATFHFNEITRLYTDSLPLEFYIPPKNDFLPKIEIVISSL